MRHKNTKSLKNLKQYRNKVRFAFYVVWRPRAQKWFFPICFLIFLVACFQHWYSHRGVWNFENTAVPAISAHEAESQTRENGELSSTEDETVVANTKGELVSPAVEVVKKVAEEESIDWKILYALFKKETQLDCEREGDHQFIKPSWGCYQINKHYHPEVTWEQATDLEWSSHWTAKRLKAKAEKYGWDNAIAMHNGNPTNPAVQAYLADVKKIIETL